MNTIFLILTVLPAGDCYSRPVYHAPAYHSPKHTFTYNSYPKHHYSPYSHYQYPATFGYAAFATPYSHYIPTPEDEINVGLQLTTKGFTRALEGLEAMRGAGEGLKLLQSLSSRFCPDPEDNDVFSTPAPSQGAADHHPSPPAAGSATVSWLNWETTECSQCHSTAKAAQYGDGFEFNTFHDLTLLSYEKRREVDRRLSTKDINERMPRGGDQLPEDRMSLFKHALFSLPQGARP